ncbi:protein IWS1 homolog A-like [Symsagittifera roscoffensis]|uniref:protein IWS1 homolog A-like n=1 Tax=Symsagittifera roscoffensis TaxID=84072 RepID=UPI00307C7386
MTPSTSRYNNKEVIQVEDDDEDEIVICRSSAKKETKNSRRSSRIKTREEIEEEKEKKIEELQNKLRKTPKEKRKPVIDEDSESEKESNNQKDPQVNGKDSGSSDDEQIVISRSASKRTPSRRISKLENKKVEKQELINTTLGKTPTSAEKRPKNVIDSDDSDEDTHRNSSSKKKKRPIVDDASQDASLVTVPSSASKSKSKHDKNDSKCYESSDSELLVLEDSDVDELGSESDAPGLPEDDVEDESENADWRKALHQVMDSDMRMKRNSETQTSAFLKVIYLYLNAASFPGKGYPLHVTDSFKLYPPESGPNLRKCLQTVTDRVNAMLGKFSRATSWQTNFQFLVDRCSEISMGYTQDRMTCEACGRSNTVSSQSIEFKGTAYDRKTYTLQKISSLSYKGPICFCVGSHCVVRIEMYHMLRHYLFCVFLQCKRYAEKNLLLDHRRIRRKSTDIERDLKRIASEGNEWALDLCEMFARDMNRAANQRKGLDWSFER